MLKRRLKISLLVLVVLVIVFFAYGLLAVRGTFQKFRPASEAHGTAVAAGPPGHSIVGRFYLTGAPNPAAPIVIVLHGDAPFHNPGYQYGFASDLAQAAPGTRVIALLRPGYADPFGAKSDGDRGFASGENYTPEVTADVAAAIQSLKSQFAATSVIVVGHSGGATVAANVAALNPGLVQEIFLIGCPCDVPAFRHHMARTQWGGLWVFPTSSLSPLETLSQMRRSTTIVAISGANDPIALPEYAQAYIAKASSQGIPASMILLRKQGHEILNDPGIIEQVAKAIQQPR